MNTVLSIAGSDSGGGAGIQADLKTCEAHDCFGLTALTALTAQNTQSVKAIQPVSAAFLRAQLEAVSLDFELKAIKTGMLGSVASVKEVRRFLLRYALSRNVPYVLDPVMVSTSGDVLMAPPARDAMLRGLFPLATIVTPNIPEAEYILGRELRSFAEAKQAAADLGQFCPNAFVLLKGAHLLEEADVQSDTALAKDVLFRHGEMHVFAEPYLRVGPLHGTGCTLSAAIACNLAHGLALPEAVKKAKTYVTNAILMAPAGVGRGSKPLRHNLPLFNQ